MSKKNRAPEKLGIAVIFWEGGTTPDKGDSCSEGETELKGGMLR